MSPTTQGVLVLMVTLVMLHPLPTHGGMMDSHIFRKAAWRLPAPKSCRTRMRSLKKPR